VLLACSDCIGVNALREVRGVHNAEVATDSLGLGLGESGGRSEAHEAEGGNDIDQDGGLHVDVLRGKSEREEKSDFSLLENCDCVLIVLDDDG
jgi:hypothetical protein